MSKFIFIADVFVDDCPGGGEASNAELINQLIKLENEVEQFHSFFITPDYIKNNLDKTFIIGNFINLSNECLIVLEKNARYFIYEHDFKFCKARTPTAYKNFEIPESEIVHYNFYKEAEKVVFQSKKHLEIAQKNLNLDNLIAAPTNLWSDEQLEVLKRYINSEKPYEYAILQSSIDHKNTAGAISYCRENGLNFRVIQELPHEQYIEELAKFKKFVFFTKIFETLSRTCVEAKVLGLDIVGNENIGFLHEDYKELKGLEMLNYLTEKRQEVVNIFCQ